MDANVVQLVTGTVGVIGTLTAALLTQALARRTESDRRAAEDRARWLNERHRINSALISNGLRIEREAYNDAALLDNETRDERLPGYLNIYVTPTNGLEGILEAWVRSTLIEDLDGMHAAIITIEGLMGEIQLLGTPQEEQAAVIFLDELLGAMSTLEAFSKADDAYAATRKVRAAREEFARAARVSLAVDIAQP